MSPRPSPSRSKRRSALFRTLKQLQTFRAALLIVALELVSLQAWKLSTGEYLLAIVLSFTGCLLVGVYVLLSPELYIFRWD